MDVCFCSVHDALNILTTTANNIGMIGIGDIHFHDNTATLENTDEENAHV